VEELSTPRGKLAGQGTKNAPMNLFQGNRCSRPHSVDRLRSLYADLLQCIAINTEDLSPRGVETEQGTRSLSFFPSLIPRRYARNGSEGDDDERTVLRKQELAVAFRLMAATRSADKEGVNGGTALRSEASVQATTVARKLETKVCSIIRDIGEVVANSQQPRENAQTDLREDDTFAYFCEKAILALLVVIAKDKPETRIDHKEGKNKNSCFHGVVWSAKVKAQVLQSVGLLVSSARDPSTLYFILSQHCINQLVLSIQPLNQWTDPALDVLLPAYADLLKTLSLQLGGNPELFPFFTIQHDCSQKVVSFPLFSALIQIATSAYAQSDSYVYATCLNLIVGLMRISDAPVRKWICQSEREQRLFCNHIAKQLLERYRRISNLSTGPVVDAVRSKAIGGQLLALNDQIDAVNDIFWCNIDILNVRFCEILLQRFIVVLLRDLVPGNSRNFLAVGVSDLDVVPDQEAAAQASTIVLSHLFLHLEYGPFLRMLAVALVHFRAPKLLQTWKSDAENGSDYVLTPAFNAVVEGKEGDTISNPYREGLMKALAGEYGEWRVVSSAVLLEHLLNAVDTGTLVELEVLPRTSGPNRSPAELEVSLESFLLMEHTCQSAVSTMALECATSLSLQYLDKVWSILTKDDTAGISVQKRRLVSALHSARIWFYQKTLDSQSAIQVNDIFVDVVEAEVQSRYKSFTKLHHSSGFAYHLPQHGISVYGCGPEPLVRKLRGVDLNDVEITRFYARMAIHFRATCSVVDKVFSATKSSASGGRNEALPAHPWVDEAGELTSMFACLHDKPPVGTDLDLHGRMTFRFTVQASEEKQVIANDSDLDTSARRRTLSEDLILRKHSELILVLDPTHMFIVKPFARKDVNRGTIICCIPLLDVVAAAADGERLHVAVHHDSIGLLIKNGNLVLTFDVPGTSLIVAQYLDRCRNLLRKELYEKIVDLFSGKEEQFLSENLQSFNEASTSAADAEVLRTKTY